MRWTAYTCLFALTACSTGAKTPDQLGEEDSGSVVIDDTGSGDAPCTEGWELGMCPPDFTLVDRNGDLRSFSEFRGQPTLVLGTAEW
ncbi:MAG TPA: hypothetical protein DFR83_13040 [Deltaproteobacteria bacterium]|nr:hypothetical protein [Deltaproteobacteria bacterium]